MSSPKGTIASSDPAAEAKEIADSVLSSGRRSHISSRLTLKIAQQELAKGRNRKDAEKRVKERLHQLLLSYEADRREYVKLAAALDEAAISGRDAVMRVAHEGLALHTSTRERASHVAGFYSRVLVGVRAESVADLGCGLNPLCLPWMGLPEHVRYLAVDASDAAGLAVRSFFRAFKVDGEYRQADLSEGAPGGRFDVAFMMKLLPTLDRMEEGLGLRIAAEIDSPIVIVSFPSASLCGSSKGMRNNYGKSFEESAAKAGWSCERHDFPSEVAFTVRK